VTFDARSTNRQTFGKKSFACLKGDPNNFGVTASPNASQWLKSTIHLVKNFETEIVTNSRNNNNINNDNSNNNNLDKTRRHAKELNETICQSDALQKVIFLQDNVTTGSDVTTGKDVTMERRLEIQNGIDVCSVLIEIPFGFYALVNVTFEYRGN
jgi:hypothetical protein